MAYNEWASGTWMPRPQDYPWAKSSRFGELAYIAPQMSWPTLENIMKTYNVQTNPVSGGAYQLIYPRTNRVLGQFNTVNSYGHERVAPWQADSMLNLADTLDRIDPNSYQFDLRSITKSTSPLTPSLGPLQRPANTPQPTSYSGNPFPFYNQMKGGY